MPSTLPAVSPSPTYITRNKQGGTMTSVVANSTAPRSKRYLSLFPYFWQNSDQNLSQPFSTKYTLSISQKPTQNEQKKVPLIIKTLHYS